MCLVYLLLLWDVFAGFDQGHEDIGEDGYPRDTMEITSKRDANFCESSSVLHPVKLALSNTIYLGI